MTNNLSNEIPWDWQEIPARMKAKLFASIRNIIPTIKGRIHQNSIHAYWWNGLINFGDLITPKLLEGYGFTPVLSSPAKADIVSTGSILHLIPENYCGIISGSGLLFPKMTKIFANAEILAVRGELTRQQIQAPADTVLGDPGLLAPRILQDLVIKQYNLGIVPHYSDKKNPRLSALHDRYPGEIIIIDPQHDPMKVLRQIAACEVILSSSLHGIVTADSFNIPNAWIHFSELLGGDFKFHDYNSALNIQRTPIQIDGNEKLSSLIKLTKHPPESILQTQNALHNIFLQLRRRSWQ